MNCLIQREMWHIRPKAALLCGTVRGPEQSGLLNKGRQESADCNLFFFFKHFEFDFFFFFSLKM